MSDVSLPTDPRQAGPGAGVGAPSGRGPEATYRGAGETGGGPDVTADGRADAVQASGGGTRQTLGECSVTATRQTLGEWNSGIRGTNGGTRQPKPQQQQPKSDSIAGHPVSSFRREQAFLLFIFFTLICLIG